jgi:Legume lectin domain
MTIASTFSKGFLKLMLRTANSNKIFASRQIGLLVAAAASTLFAPAASKADVIDCSAGFTSNSNFVVNQNAAGGLTWKTFHDNILQITTNDTAPGGAWPFERQSVFFNKQVNVSAFQTSFDFTSVGNPGYMADGLTFCIQNAGKNALGSAGGGLAYGADPTVGTGDHIDKSVAIKFDIYQNWPDPSSSTTGLFKNGQVPTGGVDLGQYNIDLRSGHVMHVTMSYDGKELDVTIKDTKTGANAWQKYIVDIPSIVGGNTAWVGFTGGTGAATSDTEVHAWTYASPDLAPTLGTLSIDVDSICGGKVANGTVTIASAMSTDTVINLSSAIPQMGVGAQVTIPAGKTSATFPIQTSIVTSQISGSIIATLGKVSTKASLMVMPITVDFVTVPVDYVAAGQPSKGTVTLQLAAPAGGLTVNLSSQNSAVASFPATVTIPGGSISADFPITTGAVLINTPNLVTATLNGQRRTSTLTVRPLRVNAVTSSAATVTGGKAMVGTVTLEFPATAGGVKVSLSSNSSSLVVPATVVVPAGATTVNFPINTNSVKTATKTLITASSPVNNVYFNVTVNP